MTDEQDEHELLRRALNQLRSAIELLDLAAAPDQIAAHVDLGACQLAEFMGVACTAQRLSTGLRLSRD